jgi:hypothetical protein
MTRIELLQPGATLVTVMICAATVVVLVGGVGAGVTAGNGPPPVDGFENPPTDLDADGAYEDVNGDEAFTVTDVQALFVNREGETVQNNPAAFDFNDDAEVGVNDVQALFTRANGVPTLELAGIQANPSGNDSENPTGEYVSFVLDPGEQSHPSTSLDISGYTIEYGESGRTYTSPEDSTIYGHVTSYRVRSGEEPDPPAAPIPSVVTVYAGFDEPVS